MKTLFECIFRLSGRPLFMQYRLRTRKSNLVSLNGTYSHICASCPLSTLTVCRRCLWFHLSLFFFSLQCIIECVRTTYVELALGSALSSVAGNMVERTVCESENSFQNCLVEWHTSPKLTYLSNLKLERMDDKTEKKSFSHVQVEEFAASFA